MPTKPRTTKRKTRAEVTWAREEAHRRMAITADNDASQCGPEALADNEALADRVRAELYKLADFLRKRAGLGVDNRPIVHAPASPPPDWDMTQDQDRAEPFDPGAPGPTAKGSTIAQAFYAKELAERRAIAKSRRDGPGDRAKRGGR